MRRAVIGGFSADTGDTRLALGNILVPRLAQMQEDTFLAVTG